MESDQYICVRETGAQNQVVIVDMATPLAPQRRQITADSALMCPDKKVIALKATTPGTPGDALQVFNLDTKTKLKAHQMPESVEFWKWITPNMLGLVTSTSVYHWDIQVCCRRVCHRQERSCSRDRSRAGGRPGSHSCQASWACALAVLASKCLSLQHV